MAKRTEQPPIPESLERATVELGGELRYSHATHYLVTEIAPGEFASVIARAEGYSVHWPWGSSERVHFNCPDLTHVRNVLADLLTTPYPESRKGV